MKFPSTVLVSAMLLAACGGGGDGDTAVAPDGVVRIAVQTPDGTAVADANVEVDGQSATTDSAGHAEFTLSTDFTGKASVSKTGYMGQQIEVIAAIANDTSSFDAVVKQMVLAGEDIDFSGAATTPVKVEGTDGASVTIDDNNAFASEDGSPYTGLVDVYITPVDVTDQEDVEAFPGEYLGVQFDEEEPVPLVSYGMADYTFTDQTGAELQLAEGVTASIDIPFFEQTAIAGFEEALTDGDSVQIWTYDYDEQAWLESDQGLGVVTTVTVNGEDTLVLRGTVDHFSPKNIDACLTEACRSMFRARAAASRPPPPPPPTGVIRATAYCPGVNDTLVTSASARASMSGRRGSLFLRNGSGSARSSLGTTCVTLTNVSCPSGAVMANKYSTQCTTIRANQTSTVVFRAN